MQKLLFIILSCWFLASVYPARVEEWSLAARELDKAQGLIETSKQPGPAAVELQEQALLHLPDGFSFVPMPAAGDYARALGNHPNRNFLGLIFTEQNADSGFVTVEYIDAGYVKDDRAQAFDDAALLESYKQTVEAKNQDRVRRGFPALDVAGWVEKPHYDAASHRLSWSIALRTDDWTESAAQSVVYHAYVLGRNGYFSINLNADRNTLAAWRPKVDRLLAGLKFKAGNTYDDFNAAADKTAAFGMSSLVGGDAAKRTETPVYYCTADRLADLAIVVGVVLLGFSFREIFKRRENILRI